MDFPTFVQGLFLVIVLVLIIVTILFFRKPATRKALSQDQRAVFLFVTLGGIFIISLLVGIKLSAWKARYQQASLDEQLEKKLSMDEFLFVERSYKPMSAAYQRLRESGDGLDEMLAKIARLLPVHNNHRPMLETLLDTFKTQKQRQEALYKKVNLEIRNAMLQSATTQDALSIHNQFHHRATVLHQQMTGFDTAVQKSLGQAAGLLEDNLKAARSLLAETLIPLKQRHQGRKGKQRPTLLSGYDFPDTVVQLLLQYLSQSDPDSTRQTREMIQQIIIARQNKDMISAWKKREPELLVPITKTEKLWQNAENKGLYYLGTLLYAVEAAYLADQFNMPHRNRAYSALMKEIRQVAPRQLDVLVQTNKEAKGSFFPLNYAEKKQK